MHPSFAFWPRTLRLVCLSLALCTFDTSTQPIAAQSSEPPVTAQSLERARTMLKQIKKDLYENYYDSTFHGLDMGEQFRQADSALGTAPTNNHIWAIIAQVLEKLRDSHTRFIPPRRVARIDYGFSMQIVGDSVYVVRVKKGSDAETKGLKVGDAVLSIDNIKVERSSFGTLAYVYYALRPRPGMRLGVASPDGSRREIVAMARITEGERIIDYTDPSTITRLINESDSASRIARHYWAQMGDTVMVWRMPRFVYGDQVNINEMMGRVKKHKALILDLRNNPGGAVVTEQYFVSGFFDRDVMLYVERERKKIDTVFAKPRGEPFRGMFIILVNSASASASEITARVMQLEGRAIVVGDRTAGAVVTSRSFSSYVGFERVTSYGLSVTVSDVIMSDGNRLEDAGVIPDEVVLPSGPDIAARRDPVMARALAMVGVTRTPEEAAKILRPKDPDQKKP